MPLAIAKFCLIHIHVAGAFHNIHGCKMYSIPGRQEVGKGVRDQLGADLGVGEEASLLFLGLL